MKKLLAGILFLAASIPSYADVDADTFCRSMSVMAEKVMDARQSGMSMSVAMGASENMSDLFTPIYRHMVIDAYSRNLYFTQDYKDKEIVNFGAEHYIDCLDAQD